jgi:hypothetical protein
MDVSKRSLFATYPHTGRVTAVQYFNEYILTVSILMPARHGTLVYLVFRARKLLLTPSYA